MDRKIYDLLVEMQAENREMKEAITTIVHTQEIMHQNVHKMLQTQDEMKDDIQEVKETLAKLGEMFEHTVKIQQDAVSKLDVEKLDNRVEKVESVLFRITQN